MAFREQVEEIVRGATSGLSSQASDLAESRLRPLINQVMGRVKAIEADGWVTTSRLAAVPHARVTRSATQSIAHNTTTAVQFNSQTYEQGGNLHDTVTNNTRLTAPVAGLYTMDAKVEWASTTPGVRQVFIRANGATNITQDFDAKTHVPLATQYRLAANEYVELVVYQDSGAAVNVNTSTYLAMTFASV